MGSTVCPMHCNAAPRIAAVIFSVVAVAHLLRLIFQIQIVIGSVTIPLWASGFAVVVPAVLAGMLWCGGKHEQAGAVHE